MLERLKWYTYFRMALATFTLWLLCRDVYTGQWLWVGLLVPLLIWDAYRVAVAFADWSREEGKHAKWRKR